MFIQQPFIDYILYVIATPLRLLLLPSITRRALYVQNVQFRSTGPLFGCRLRFTTNTQRTCLLCRHANTLYARSDTTRTQTHLFAQNVYLVASEHPLNRHDSSETPPTNRPPIYTPLPQKLPPALTSVFRLFMRLFEIDCSLNNPQPPHLQRAKLSSRLVFYQSIVRSSLGVNEIFGQASDGGNDTRIAACGILKKGRLKYNNRISTKYRYIYTIHSKSRNAIVCIGYGVRIYNGARSA